MPAISSRISASARRSRTRRRAPSPTATRRSTPRSTAPASPSTRAAGASVIGLKENSSRKTGLVYVRTTGTNQRGEEVLRYVRWVMVKKRDEGAAAPGEQLPNLPASVAAADLRAPMGLKINGQGYDRAAAGSQHVWDDYAPGEKIDHVDGMTIEEAEHQLATR